MKKWLRGLVVAPLCVGLLAGCVSTGPAGDGSAGQAGPSEEVLAGPELHDSLRRLASDVGQEHGGRIGIAVATAEGVTHVGLTGHSYAWSTIKVPVAVVADREEVATEDLIEASISNSDNEAAYQLSQAIDLDLGGLPHVPDLAPLPGETIWPLVEQAAFAAELPCLDGADRTYEAMGDIVDWQSYGLANIDDAHFKGGWGLDAPRVYALRQFATVPVAGGQIGVAVIAYPDDADHDTAVEILDDVGIGLAGFIEDDRIGPALRCGE